ncbi:MULTISPECIES: hypothetical protein [Rhizobium]|uniref:Glutathione S-transferase n=1 Tax=Rhizobium paranaense TaxID=1650438 RepID=A0A7W8XXJ4_9HYPH|nr:hypothetical protein [Rhizobium paranaense]MBB5577366.1 glutathione S-transferase [Rhizobium paranaense]
MTRVAAVWDRVSETFAVREKTFVKDDRTGSFWHGDRPGLLDVCLNNRRFDVDILPCPTISRIFDSCAELPAFVQIEL